MLRTQDPICKAERLLVFSDEPAGLLFSPETLLLAVFDQAFKATKLRISVCRSQTR